MIEHDYEPIVATFFDRFAIGVAATVVAFITLAMLWCVVVYFSFIVIPFKAIIITSLIFGMIGFLTLDRYLLVIFRPIWQFIAKVIGIEERPL